MSTVHIERIDLNLMVMLQAVYVEGSITKAAQRLNVTQPAVSHALRRLRDVLGDPLFVRHGSTITPTPFTRNLMGPVVSALATLQLAISGSEHFDPASMGRRFTIGIRDSLEVIAAPVLMERLIAQSPQSQVNCIRIDHGHLADELATGTLDCAVELPLNLDAAIHRQRLDTRDRMVVLARPGHPALAKGRLTLATYLKQDHIAVSSRRTGETFEDAALNRAGHQRNVRMRVQRHVVAVNLVAQTDMLLTMPEQYEPVVNAVARNRLHAFPMAMPPVDYYLYWHRSVDGNPANLWIRQQIVDAFAQHGAA